MRGLTPDRQSRRPSEGSAPGVATSTPTAPVVAAPRGSPRHRAAGFPPCRQLGEMPPSRWNLTLAACRRSPRPPTDRRPAHLFRKSPPDTTAPPDSRCQSQTPVTSAFQGLAPRTFPAPDTAFSLVSESVRPLASGSQWSPRHPPAGSLPAHRKMSPSGMWHLPSPCHPPSPAGTAPTAVLIVAHDSLPAGSHQPAEFSVRQKEF